MADIVAKVGGEQLGRNNRITANQFLNRHCASGLDLESILLARMQKIFLQQYRHVCDIVMCRLEFRLRLLSGLGAERP
jgi:hypothetical protein